MQTYYGYLIERNIHGYYTAFLEYAGMYGKSDTLSGIKRLIKQDIETAKIFTNHN